MEKIFMIVAESGSYSDYRKHNICGVTSLEQAEKFCELLNKAAEVQQSFNDGDLRTFETEYRAANPTPPFPNLPSFPYKHPQLPGHLSNIKRKERSGPMYEAYLVEKTEYDRRLAIHREQVTAIQTASGIAQAEWYDKYNNARQNFITKNLKIAELFPEEIREKLLVYFKYAGYESSYSWEEIDIINDMGLSNESLGSA